MIERRVIEHMVRGQAQDILDVRHDFGRFTIVEREHAVENCDLVVPQGFFAFPMELEEGLEFGFFEAEEGNEDQQGVVDGGAAASQKHTYDLPRIRAPNPATWRSAMRRVLTEEEFQPGVAGKIRQIAHREDT